MKIIKSKDILFSSNPKLFLHQYCRLIEITPDRRLKRNERFAGFHSQLNRIKIKIWITASCIIVRNVRDNAFYE